MLINPHQVNVEAVLRDMHSHCPAGNQVLLLVDGAFVPGIFRQLQSKHPILLFRTFPGFSESVRDVSPFILKYDPADRLFSRLLKECSGWPMLSAIITSEPAEKFADRLAAWCIVESGNQRFNFRFPDTRRLPAIFDVLTENQREEMIGAALDWYYIGRAGKWERIAITPSAAVRAITENAELSDIQFAELLKDSAADEMWMRLKYRGIKCNITPFLRHELLAAALVLADKEKVGDFDAVEWCSVALDVNEVDISMLADRFSEWVEVHISGKHENTQMSS